MTDLYRAVTLHLPADEDREQIGRLIEAMCRLNGIPVAIELHAPPAVNGSEAESRGSVR